MLNTYFCDNPEEGIVEHGCYTTVVNGVIMHFSTDAELMDCLEDNSD